MVVGYNITVGRDNHTRTRSLPLGRLHFATAAATVATAEEIAEEILERVVIFNALRARINGNLYVNHRVYGLLGRICQIYGLANNKSLFLRTHVNRFSHNRNYKSQCHNQDNQSRNHEFKLFHNLIFETHL